MVVNSVVFAACRVLPFDGVVMAKQVITVLTDDIDGGDADRTIEFGLDRVNYTIDLSEKTPASSARRSTLI
jgi:hypothetical protein